MKLIFMFGGEFGEKSGEIGKMEKRGCEALSHNHGSSCHNVFHHGLL